MVHDVDLKVFRPGFFFNRCHYVFARPSFFFDNLRLLMFRLGFICQTKFFSLYSRFLISRYKFISRPSFFFDNVTFLMSRLRFVRQTKFFFDNLRSDVKVRINLPFRVFFPPFRSFWCHFLDFFASPSLYLSRSGFLMQIEDNYARPSFFLRCQGL